MLHAECNKENPNRQTDLSLGYDESRMDNQINLWDDDGDCDVE